MKMPRIRLSPMFVSLLVLALFIHFRRQQLFSLLYASSFIAQIPHQSFGEKVNDPRPVGFYRLGSSVYFELNPHDQAEKSLHYTFEDFVTALGSDLLVQRGDTLIATWRQLQADLTELLNSEELQCLQGLTGQIKYFVRLTHASSELKSDLVPWSVSFVWKTAGDTQERYKLLGSYHQKFTDKALHQMRQLIKVHVLEEGGIELHRRIIRALVNADVVFEQNLDFIKEIKEKLLPDPDCKICRSYVGRFFKTNLTDESGRVFTQSNYFHCAIYPFGSSPCSSFSSKSPLFTTDYWRLEKIDAFYQDPDRAILEPNPGSTDGRREINVTNLLDFLQRTKEEAIEIVFRRMAENPASRFADLLFVIDHYPSVLGKIIPETTSLETFSYDYIWAFAAATEPKEEETKSSPEG